MRSLSLVLGLLALAGCSNPAPSAKPCEGNNPCPGGARCKSKNDCTADAGFTCTNGACMRPCAAGEVCGAGEICGAVTGTKRCLTLCTEGKCAAGAGCQTFWPTRQQVCADVPLTGACASVVNESKCTECGKKLFTTRCASGYVCPSSSVCDPLILPTGGCYCGAGFETVACDGSPCVVNGQNVCFPPNYTCRPVDLPATLCTGEPHAGGGKCKCTDGRTVPFVCGETNSCEQKCSTGCSVTAQDCPDAWAPKCTLLLDEPVLTQPNSDPLERTTCVAQLGTLALGEKCTRVPFTDGGTAYGRDDCAKGLVCESVGAPPGQLRCRKLCTAKAQCAVGEGCLVPSLSLPAVGFCLPSGCTLGGAECGPGKSCTSTQNVDFDPEQFCKVDGPNAAGVSCATDAGLGCQANVRCSDGTCRAICSPQRPCTSGVCSSTTGAGVCQ